jgi:hypothetical protein
MDKNKIISILENSKPDNIKISQKITKTDLVSILEASILPDTFDLQRKSKSDRFIHLPTITREDKEPIEEPKKAPVKEAPKQNTEEPKKEQVKIDLSKKFGFKSIILNENFFKIDEYGKMSISDMFKDSEVDFIKNNNDISKWVPLKGSDTLYCKEKHFSKETGTTINCYDSELKSTRRYAIYGILLRKIFELSEGKEPIIAKEEKYVAVSPKNNVQIAGLKISDKKQAIVIKLPEEPNLYLFAMTPNTVMFLFDYLK